MKPLSLTGAIKKTAQDLDRLANGAIAAGLGGSIVFAAVIGGLTWVPTAMFGGIAIYRGGVYLLSQRNRDTARLLEHAREIKELAEELASSALPAEIRSRLLNAATADFLPHLERGAVESEAGLSAKAVDLLENPDLTTTERLAAVKKLRLERAGPALRTLGSEADNQRSPQEMFACVQRMLADLGYNPGPADGEFGRSTKSAIIHFQQDHMLTVDGVLGPRTWKVLRLVHGTLGQWQVPPAKPPR